MNWFEGSIPEAITAAKNRKAIFVVYVRDSSEASKKSDEVLSARDVVEVMGDGHFVAIKLENGTEGAKQFSQIYPLMLVPSMFFISAETGIPLEVLGGPLTSENLKDKINKLITDSKQRKDGNSSGGVSGTSQAPEDSKEKTSNEGEVGEASGPASASASVPEAEDKDKTNTEDMTPIPDTPPQDENSPPDEASGTSNTEESPSGLSLEDRVERAKHLLAQKKMETAREEAKEEQRKEIERRKMIQEVAKRKQQQEEEERRAAFRQRRKDNEEDRLARERVRAQIAADRAKKYRGSTEYREALLKGDAPSDQPAASSSTPPSVPHAPSSSNISRLKFRLPDGSFVISQFPAETSLNEVRQYVEQNLALSSTFILASTVQHRPFTPDDYSTSLRDLGLVPSAIIAVITSASSSTGSVASTGGGIWNMLWVLLSPITFIFGLLQHYLLGSRGASTDSTARAGEPQRKRPREDLPSTTQQRPTTAYGRRGEVRFRQQGNIHHFQNDGDDDDDNNTWNGNSTQQM